MEGLTSEGDTTSDGTSTMEMGWTSRSSRSSTIDNNDAEMQAAFDASVTKKLPPSGEQHNNKHWGTARQLVLV